MHEVVFKNYDDLTTDGVAMELTGKDSKAYATTGSSEKLELLENNLWVVKNQVGTIFLKVHKIADELHSVCRVVKTLAYFEDERIQTAWYKNTPGFSEYVPVYGDFVKPAKVSATVDVSASPKLVVPSIQNQDVPSTVLSTDVPVIHSPIQ
ncbi:Hypothetical predicted protein [Olea europaea subsp. europaea]|uniref:Uncharacterized protein n=1 Tax=Olea europaea subsp. europaea TaxID=158383 RepID=A0A8S0VPV7_OLEEU|nr:Hypothetical predicted protein [Olea europaea subsp. europaea]